jgi:hypothetical protein
VKRLVNFGEAPNRIPKAMAFCPALHTTAARPSKATATTPSPWKDHDIYRSTASIHKVLRCKGFKGACHFLSDLFDHV